MNTPLGLCRLSQKELPYSQIIILCFALFLFIYESRDVTVKVLFVKTFKMYTFFSNKDVYYYTDILKTFRILVET